MSRGLTKGRKVTETFSVARCETCGSRVGYEDGMKVDLCPCDPRCDLCGRQFISAHWDANGSFLRYEQGGVCDECIEAEMNMTFSEEFLESLSTEQMHGLIRDTSRRLTKGEIAQRSPWETFRKEAVMVAKAECEQQGAAVDPRLLQLLREKRLTADPNFYILAIYYSSLKEGGDGELMVKLLKGKMTIKGATYLRKVVAP